MQLRHVATVSSDWNLARSQGQGKSSCKFALIDSVYFSRGWSLIALIGLGLFCSSSSRVPAPLPLQWERRVPLVPEQVDSLTRKGIRVLVQPSERRIFTDDEVCLRN